MNTIKCLCWRHRYSPTAVYGEDETAKTIALANKEYHYVFSGNRIQKYAENHVVLMETDEKSYRFCQEHEESLHKGRLYMGLRQIATPWMRDEKKVHFFNIQEITARNYWKNYPITEISERKPDYHIAIIGFRSDGQGYSLLKYALVNNILVENQAIIYDVFCSDAVRCSEFDELGNMNGDQVKWHNECWQNNYEIIGWADRIIITEAVTPEILNRLIPMCRTAKIFCYMPGEQNTPEKSWLSLYKYPELYFFGNIAEILTHEAIQTNKLYQEAMMANYYYENLYGSEENQRKIASAKNADEKTALAEEFWEQLDGFSKSSNIAASDFREVQLAGLKREGVGLDALSMEEKRWMAKAEHIRWSRFHFVNHWRYGIPQNGKRKDPVQRIHADLIPWEQLSCKEQQKDMDQILAFLQYEEINIFT
ncbi:MAG: hypothetical protein LUD16_02480 [Lachnospiraceae bacterium]|nr:hypothetical protein [Lachnospiraceae bacterium]